MSEEWTHPTMADAGYNQDIRCTCGRLKGPEYMLDVRSLGVGQTWLCVPCVQDHFKKGTIDHITLHRRAGAPTEWLEAYDAKLRNGPLHRPGLSDDQWGEILARHLDEAAPEEMRWGAQLAQYNIQPVLEVAFEQEYIDPPTLPPDSPPDPS